MKISLRRQRGLSLIEALVTVLIFSVGLLGLVGLQTRAVQVSTGAEDTNRAALLANELASQMWLTKTTSLNETTIDAWKARVANPVTGGLPNGTAAVTVVGTEANILIEWKSPNAPAADPKNKYQTQVVIR